MQEIFVLQDCYWHDDASTNKSSSYTVSNTTLTHNTDHYTSVSGTSSSASDYIALIYPNISITDKTKVLIEYDVRHTNGETRDIWGLIFIDNIIVASSNQKTIELGDFNNAKGICYRDTAGFHSDYRTNTGLSNNNWYHMKLEINGTNITGTITSNGSNIYSQTVTLSVASNLNYLCVYQADATSTIEFKNLKIKAL